MTCSEPSSTGEAEWLAKRRLSCGGAARNRSIRWLSRTPGAPAINRRWNRCEAGGGPSHGWMCCIERTWKPFYRDFGIDPAGVPASELNELNLAWHRLDPWPDAVAGLTRLKTNFIIAPLSNGNIALMLDMAKRAGLPWDAILGAEVVQAYKPTPEAYLRTADILAMRPEQICLVAAHNGDLAAARKCGLRTAFIPRPAEHGPNQTTDLRPDQEWDVVAADFGALAEKLGV